MTPKIGKAPVKTLTQPEGSGPEEGDFLAQGQTVFSDSCPTGAPSLAWSSVLPFVSPSVPGLCSSPGPLGAFPELLPEPALPSSDFSRPCVLVAFPGALASFEPGTGKAKGPSLELCSLFSSREEHFPSALQGQRGAPLVFDVPVGQNWLCGGCQWVFLSSLLLCCSWNTTLPLLSSVCWCFVLSLMQPLR